VWIAGCASERWITGKASTRSRGGSRIYTRLAQCGSSAAPATARFVISRLWILCGVNYMKIEKGVCLNEVGALMYFLAPVGVYIVCDVILDVNKSTPKRLVKSLKLKPTPKSFGYSR